MARTATVAIAEGSRFGRLTVIARDLGKVRPFSVFWRCQCKCGNLTTVESRELRKAKTISCGCAKSELSKAGLKIIDIAGKKYGRLSVLKMAQSGTGTVKWHVLCDCGRHKVVCGSELRRGRVKSCGCLARELTSARALDLGGLRFGRLSIIERVGVRKENGHILWAAICDCGNAKNVTASSLKGGTLSCGCLNLENCSERMRRLSYERGEYLANMKWLNEKIESGLYDESDKG